MNIHGLTEEVFNLLGFDRSGSWRAAWIQGSIGRIKTHDCGLYGLYGHMAACLDQSGKAQIWTCHILRTLACGTLINPIHRSIRGQCNLVTFLNRQTETQHISRCTCVCFSLI